MELPSQRPMMTYTSQLAMAWAKRARFSFRGTTYRNGGNPEAVSLWPKPASGPG